MNLELVYVICYTVYITIPGGDNMKLFLDEVTSKEQVLADMNTMNAFGGGDRLTGTQGQRDYCEWLKSEIRAMGIDVVSKQYTFDRWGVCNVNRIVLYEVRASLLVLR